MTVTNSNHLAILQIRGTCQIYHLGQPIFRIFDNFFNGFLFTLALGRLDPYTRHILGRIFFWSCQLANAHSCALLVSCRILPRHSLLVQFHHRLMACLFIMTIPSRDSNITAVLCVELYGAQEVKPVQGFSLFLAVKWRPPYAKVLPRERCHALDYLPQPSVSFSHLDQPNRYPHQEHPTVATISE